MELSQWNVRGEEEESREEVGEETWMRREERGVEKRQREKE